MTGAVATYLAQVRAELSDLPPGELADVLDDVTGHLTEVAAEFDGEPSSAALQERLGTPRQYADELRNAAGYPPRTAPAATVKHPGKAALRWGIIAATVGPFFVAIAIFAGAEEVGAFFVFIGFAVLFLAAWLGVRALRGQDPAVVLDTPRGAKGEALIRDMVAQIPPKLRQELVTIGQPVWWVLRGAVGAGGFFLLFGAGAVAAVAAIVGAIVSVWIARRAQQDRRWLWYVVPLNVVAAVAVPAVLSAAYLGASFGVFSNGYPSSSSSHTPNDGLRLNGMQITNIYPFDAQGKQTSVLLYDQNGEPIRIDSRENCDWVQGTNSHIENQFPYGVIPPDALVDSADNCRETTVAPFTPPPIVFQTPTPPPASPTPTPSAKVTPPPASGKPSATLTVQPSR
nr:hypothetical protein [Kribbella sandramycini]